MGGHIYAVIAANGTAKVGWTGRSPRDRLKAITAGECGGWAELIRVIDGDRWLETQIHRELREHRVAGGKTKNVCEWYRDPVAVLLRLMEWPQARCPECELEFPILRKRDYRGANQKRKLRTASPGKRCHCGRPRPVNEGVIAVVA